MASLGPAVSDLLPSSDGTFLAGWRRLQESTKDCAQPCVLNAIRRATLCRRIAPESTGQPFCCWAHCPAAAGLVRMPVGPMPVGPMPKTQSRAISWSHPLDRARVLWRHQPRVRRATVKGSSVSTRVTVTSAGGAKLAVRSKASGTTSIPLSPNARGSLRLPMHHALVMARVHTRSIWVAAASVSRRLVPASTRATCSSTIDCQRCATAHLSVLQGSAGSTPASAAGPRSARTAIGGNSQVGRVALPRAVA
jgi:hypothetical protein